MFSISKRHLWMSAGLLALFFRIDVADAQLTDLTQTPNAENAGIFKSLEQQIGAGVGDINTPGSSTFIMARDPARAVRRGRQLFQRKFTQVQGFGPRTQDGIGNIETARAIGAGLIETYAVRMRGPNWPAWYPRHSWPLRFASTETNAMTV